jgi:hypothetical protein
MIRHEAISNFNNIFFDESFITGYHGIDIVYF